MFSDNQSVVETINSHKSHPAQHASLSFRESVYSFLATDSRTFIVRWIPGHSRIPGNERVDQLANLGAELVPTPIFDRTATSQKCNTTETARTTRTQIWDTAKYSEHTSRSIPNPPSLKLHVVFAKDRLLATAHPTWLKSLPDAVSLANTELDVSRNRMYPRARASGADSAVAHTADPLSHPRSMYEQAYKFKALGSYGPLL